MNTRPAGHDPFDLGFEADDEFAPSAADPWRDDAPLVRPAAGAAADDPFADFPPARPAFDDDPFADLSPSPVSAASPVPPSSAYASAPAHSQIQDMGVGDAVMGEASIPRITIHAFCARPETAELVEKAAGDRRMARAATLVRPGGIQAAVDHYQNQPTPELIAEPGGCAVPRRTDGGPSCAWE